MSLKKTVASKPSDGSAKVVSVESDEMVAFRNIYLWKEYFCLTTVLRNMPFVVPFC